MEEISFKNGEATVSAETFLAFQKNIKDAIYDLSIIQCTTNRKSVYVSENWGKVNVLLDNINLQDDKKQRFNVENGLVKIGKGVSLVKISLNCEGISHAINSDKQIAITKNGTWLSGPYQTGDVTTGYASVSISNVFVEVIEGDEIGISVSSGGSGNIELLQCILTIEAVLKGD